MSDLNKLSEVIRIVETISIRLVRVSDEMVAHHVIIQFLCRGLNVLASVGQSPHTRKALVSSQTTIHMVPIVLT